MKVFCNTSAQNVTKKKTSLEHSFVKTEIGDWTGLLLAIPILAKSVASRTGLDIARL